MTFCYIDVTPNIILWRLYQILKTRISIKEELDRTGSLPKFPEHSECRNKDWRVAPVPTRLQCRHIDLGDVSPSNTDHFIAALNSKAQGVQVCYFRI